MKPTTRHGAGQTGEYLVAAELARQGFTVALPTGNAEAIDIIAYGFGQSVAIQVKTAGRGDHQFNVGKFLKIVHEPDGRQIVVGPRDDLDPKILVVFVFLGDKAGADEFAWTSQGRFADFLAKMHREYLEKHGGRRPGKNPKSLHAALSRSQLQQRFPSQTALEFLNSEKDATGAPKLRSDPKRLD